LEKECDWLQEIHDGERAYPISANPINGQNKNAIKERHNWPL